MAALRFARETLTVNGVAVEMLTAGRGEPLMFWHGAGTIGGFDFALPWAERFRLLIPYHVGWGGSGDDDSIASMQDHVMHYLDLLDQLGLETIRLVGLSMGGWMAACFATQHAHRLKKLALVAPAGLRVPEFPITDLFKLRPEEIPGYLAANIEALRPFLPQPGDVEAAVRLFREQTSFARIAWERAYDPKLARWLHRITVPTLLVWGEADRIIPFGQAQSWTKLIPKAGLRSFKNAGHLVLNERPEAVAAIGDFLA